MLFSYLSSIFQMPPQHKHYISSITKTAVTCLQSYYDRKLINNLCIDNLIPKKKKKKKKKGLFLIRGGIF